MVRHRKVLKNTQNATNNETSSSSGGSDTSSGYKSFKILSFWKTGAGVLCFVIAAYISVLGYLETRVNTPFDDEKVVRELTPLSERFWGTYRPGVYMGVKSREPRSPVFGLMWYELAPTSNKGIRHLCEQSDNLPQYGWTHHDGTSFGEQVILDPPHKIVTSFLKTVPTAAGCHWTVRVNISDMPGNTLRSPISLIWYAALDESLGPAAPHSRLWSQRGTIYGQTPTHDNFKIDFHTLEGSIIHISQSEANAPLHQLKERLLSLLRVEQHQLGRIAVLGPDETLDENRKVNFIPIQFIVQPPFAMDIVYYSEPVPTEPLRGEEYTRVLEERRRHFDREFEEKFHLEENGYTREEISTAKAAMSNMLGGIGYFYGAGRVRSQYTKEPVPYWRAALYTAVPSRSFFPRGFLWDEGFHLQLISRWSPDIAVDIAAHWMDLINVEGWIPREQILGVEALARVPKEFVVQSNAAANPPMLLVTLASMIRRRPDLFAGVHRPTLLRMYSRLQAWFNWFQTTQKGTEPTTYRWRGRVDDGVQLNPKTLSSGLDDYPRASHPSDIERHLDLRCWMYAASDAMVTIANTLHMDSSRYEEIRNQLSDEELLINLHWSPQTQTYADYGLHTDAVKLVRPKPKTKHPPEEEKVVRVVSNTPTAKLVTSAFGYISLFPMLLKVLKPNSEKLGKILETLDKPDLLWSPYGLRSLSKSSPLYMKRNTEHDPPYWRGQVWISINYLALASLKHYSVEGIHASRARELHDRLRENVVTNIIKEYNRTGYLWEQYSSENGKGSGCRPFTGWTALLVNIMSGDY